MNIQFFKNTMNIQFFKNTSR